MAGKLGLFWAKNANFATKKHIEPNFTGFKRGVLYSAEFSHEVGIGPFWSLYRGQNVDLTANLGFSIHFGPRPPLEPNNSTHSTDILA